MGKVHFLALLAGAAADIGGTYVNSFTMTIGLGVWAGLHHITPGAFYAALLHHPFFLLTGYFMGLCFTFLGGYVTALLCPSHRRWNVLILGTAMTLLGLCWIHETPLWYTILGTITVLPVTFLAALLVECLEARLPKSPEAA